MPHRADAESVVSDFRVGVYAVVEPFTRIRAILGDCKTNPTKIDPPGSPTSPSEPVGIARFEQRTCSFGSKTVIGRFEQQSSDWNNMSKRTART